MSNIPDFEFLKLLSQLTDENQEKILETMRDLKYRQEQGDKPDERSASSPIDK